MQTTTQRNHQRTRWETTHGLGPLDRGQAGSQLTTLPARRAERGAKALGWFSLGLATVQLVAPRALCRAVGGTGTRTQRRVMRALGARELVTGVAILTGRRSNPAMWGRVLGDLVDLTLLATLFGSRRPNRVRLLASTAAVVGATAIDLVACRALERSGPDRGVGRDIRIAEAITVNRSPHEVYAFWRDASNLPRFLSHVTSVEMTSPTTSRWRAHGPADIAVEWDAEIVEEIPDSRIVWRSVPGSPVRASGRVELSPAPGGRGTEMRVSFSYDSPAGAIGQAVVRLLGREPSQQLGGDLRRLKQTLETGEVLHSDASVHRGPHPARPSRSSEEADR